MKSKLGGFAFRIFILVVGLAFNTTFASAQEPHYEISVWLSQAEKTACTKPAVNTQKCLFDYLDLETVYLKAVTEATESYLTHRAESIKYKKELRSAVKVVRVKYHENVPEQILRYVYWTSTERDMGIFLSTKANFLRWDADRLMECAKLFGKEQHKCKKVYIDGYLKKVFASRAGDRIIWKYIREMNASYKKQFGHKRY